jgi:hypothetical protein
MKEPLAVIYLLSPLLLGLAVHGVFIKFNWLPALCRAVDGGATLRGRRIFGANKTYRGIVVVGLGTAIGFTLQALVLHRFASARGLELLDYSFPRAALAGFIVGAAAMLAELPNSFIKRQLEIAPGGLARGWKGFFFYALDQVDFLMGVWLVLAFFMTVTMARVVWSLIFLFISHQLMSGAGYLLGVRQTFR